MDDKHGAGVGRVLTDKGESARLRNPAGSVGKTVCKRKRDNDNTPVNIHDQTAANYGHLMFANANNI